MENIPHIDPTLVTYLLKVFTLEVMEPGTPTDKIFFKMGQRSVVEWLVSRLRIQEDGDE